MTDPIFDKPGHIDLILGSDVFEDLVLDGKLDEENDLQLTNTVFGWVVSGKTPDSSKQLQTTITILKSVMTFDLSQFWELEEVPSSPKLTAEEQACEAHFQQTTTQDEDGRFVVQLPFKDAAPPMRESFLRAKQRLTKLGQRLIRNSSLQAQYSAFIKEFLDLKHLEEVPLDELQKPNEQVYYLLHHCVHKEDSTTTKLRVVFDGSAKSENGFSLNDSLMVGPIVQSDLFSILVRFRFHVVALSADIAKMYRQFALDKSSKDFHRILWRDNPAEPLRHLRMNIRNSLFCFPLNPVLG